MVAHYTDERNAQIIIHLLKFHGIRHVVASPGTTNMALVVSLQDDDYFNVYSCVDERSAAYMACGLSAELGAPVVLSCTGATASRNYLSGLTEAFYRKLPILAITSTQNVARVGQHIAQVIDRSSIQNDVAKLSVHLPIVTDEESQWECEIKANRAILELKRHGGGPVHINLTTSYSTSFDTKDLPVYRVIERFTHGDELPSISGKIAIFIGSHNTWPLADQQIIDQFCSVHDAVVFCDHTSGYRGQYRLPYALAAGQENLDYKDINPDILIHIGEISGDYETMNLSGKEVWRVSPDGEIRDTFRKLRRVFEMSESNFFAHYANGTQANQRSYFDNCMSKLTRIRENLPDLPFSNIWVASQMASRIPAGSAIHFGILNSLRAWNFFVLPDSVTSFSNVGGFGIDGCMSSLIGASLANPDKLYFLVIGDLAFFYDMNVLGNRHVGKNVRILLVNNGKGTEFTQYGHNGNRLGEGANRLVAADGHFGRKSQHLVANYATNLGFRYLSALDKGEFMTALPGFLSGAVDQSVLFEVFTEGNLESEALEMIKSSEQPTKEELLKRRVKRLAKGILGQNGIQFVRKFMGQ